MLGVKGKVKGSMLGPKIAKDVKSCTYCCYVSCATNSMSRGYYLPPRLSDKVRVIKGMVVCYVVWLVSMEGMVLRTYARCTGLLVPFCGYRAQVPQHNIDKKCLCPWTINLCTPKIMINKIFCRLK